MRGILILTMLAASLAYGAANDYVEARDLRLPSDGIEKLEIDAGAGTLEVTGVAGVTEIVVAATITVPSRNEAKARRIIKSDMVLKLEQEGERALLVSHFDSGLWSWDGHPHIDINVTVPEGITLLIDDGSGSMKIANVRGDITIDDGSGSISMVGVGGDVRIDDGSGSISVKEVGESLDIVDGSGSITVRTVGGSVSIDDGSGGIDVSDVAQDLIIEDDGSGSLKFARIQGAVEKHE